MIKTIQITLDESLVKNVDLAVIELKTTRSAFIRDALEEALQTLEIHKLEGQHTQGYAQYPVAQGEFDGWEDEQVWPIGMDKRR